MTKRPLDIRGVLATGGKDIEALAEYNRNLQELNEYRATGLTPQQIRNMIDQQTLEEAPLPLI